MDPSTRNAAMLLWKVMKTASKEMDDETKSSKRKLDSSLSASASATTVSANPPTRPRLVSIGSQDTGPSFSSRRITTTPPSSRESSPLIHPVTPHSDPDVVVMVDDDDDDDDIMVGKSANSVELSAVRMTLQVPFVPEEVVVMSDIIPSSEIDSSPRDSSILVGKKTNGNNVKAILRKKFAWKNYPELENFLIAHRAEYLQFSSSLNYTAEQKRYNNTLTNGLLELAAQHGYVFDDFTFPMVRDRIRCYYKSYVQAARKKQRRHG